MAWSADRPFERVLIANRGEIAVRVIRACAELGIRSIAVYSEADRGALHARLADEAHLIGPGPARDSYLAIPRLIDVGRRSGAQAVHPGYGFLSENPAFAEACAQAGLTFVGPSPESMRLLGDKAAARRLAAAHGVPVVPGYDGPAQDDAALAAEAQRIGFPLLVKAAAGGGGRGMRVAAAPTELAEALAAARREAGAAFGDETLILERLVVRARHVEVQVLGDHHGTLIHLGERDCSVQRRHQKVVEESPAPSVSPALRGALGEAALTVARAAGYVNAGTCEFLLDPDGRFWFIEMNARLQVEHPVTELVTGIDLVRAQLEIAAGKRLPWRQEEIAARGHAVELRLYAEDPARGDLPATGRLTRIRPPQQPGLRHDLGYADGDVVPPHYDTMLGKLIAHGADRASAIERARAALDAYVIEGLPTNRALLGWILDQPAFGAGAVTTDFLVAARPGRDDEPPPSDEALAAAVAWELGVPAIGAPAGIERPAGDWRIAGQGVLTFWERGMGQPPLAVTAHREDRRAWLVEVGERQLLALLADEHNGTVLVRGAGTDGAAPETVFRCRVTREEGGLVVRLGAARTWVKRAAPPSADARRLAHAVGGVAALEAPLPGRVVRVDVAPGDAVQAHQTLVVLEAMKIESAIVAPRDGTVQAVRCAVGDAVAGGQVLVELAPS